LDLPIKGLPTEVTASNTQYTAVNTSVIVTKSLYVVICTGKLGGQKYQKKLSQLNFNDHELFFSKFGQFLKLIWQLIIKGEISQLRNRVRLGYSGKGSD
jgi:hypothetical protein